MTLRITLQPMDSGQIVMRLEGRFRAGDLAVLESCLEEVGEDELRLDLAALQWLDPPAVKRLSELVRGGVRIVATSPFVDKLLFPDDPSSPVGRGSARHSTGSRSPK